MKKEFLEEEHKMFRDSFGEFVKQEVVPYHPQWEKEGVVSREVWRKAGEHGFLCIDVLEAYGGSGVQDFRYNAIVIEELARAGATGVGFGIHSDIVVPYITKYGTEAQKQRWLPKLVTGECISAIAMTEPDAGSDLAGMRTTAVREGDHYMLNGQKTFVTNGILSDFVIVAAKTIPMKARTALAFWL